jgi:hypothetical protein
MGFNIDVKDRKLALLSSTAENVLAFLFMLKNGKQVPGFILASLADVTGRCKILEIMMVRFHFQNVRRVVPRSHWEIGNSTCQKTQVN